MGRKGISFTFYENEEELAGLSVIKEKYDMSVNELSLEDMDSFEKTIQESFALNVCFRLFLSCHQKLQNLL